VSHDRGWEAAWTPFAGDQQPDAFPTTAGLIGDVLQRKQPIRFDSHDPQPRHRIAELARETRQGSSARSSGFSGVLRVTAKVFRVVWVLAAVTVVLAGLAMLGGGVRVGS
jgi:hypothetical protein